MVVIGLTSFNGGGKNIISEYLEKKGFIGISLSDMLREECKKRSLELTRDNLIKMGNELREKHGAGVLGKLACERIKEGQNAVVTSFRHPAEIEELKKRSDFILVKVVADQRVRFERIKARNRESDPKTFEEFVVLEERESRSSKVHEEQLAQCMIMAEYEIHNEGSFEELQEKVEEFLKNVETK